MKKPGSINSLLRRIPYVDVLDSDNEYDVKAELPGLKKETLNIQVGANELSLAADSNVEKEEEGKTICIGKERSPYSAET